MKMIFFSVLLLNCLSSCVIKGSHGYMFEYSDSHLIDIGSDKLSVYNAMGSPSFISDIDGETWFYLNEKTESFLFLPSRVVDRKILALEFTFNKVSNIRNFTKADQAKNFSFNSNKTFVDEHKSGWIKNLFSNVGQVRPQ